MGTNGELLQGQKTSLFPTSFIGLLQLVNLPVIFCHLPALGMEDLWSSSLPHSLTTDQESEKRHIPVGTQSLFSSETFPSSSGKGGIYQEFSGLGDTHCRERLPHQTPTNCTRHAFRMVWRQGWVQSYVRKPRAQADQLALKSRWVSFGRITVDNTLCYNPQG